MGRHVQIVSGKARTSRCGGCIAAAPRSRAGFTVIEILIVFAVIAVLAIAFAPNPKQAMPTLELRRFAEELAAELRMARSDAIRGNSEEWLQIDVRDRTYRRGGEADGAPFPESVLAEIVVASTEVDGQHRGRIRFLPSGASTGGEVRLVRGASGFEIEVDWFDGAVSVAAIR
jgi:general secretion pathway protein H